MTSISSNPSNLTMNNEPIKPSETEAQPSAAGTDGCACTGAKACPTVSLCVLKAGQTGVIAEARMTEDDASLLRAMGLAPGSRVMMCRQGEPCIVAVTTGGKSGAGAGGQGCSGACRIGLARPLAEQIMVNLTT